MRKTVPHGRWDESGNRVSGFQKRGARTAGRRPDEEECISHTYQRAKLSEPWCSADSGDRTDFRICSATKIRSADDALTSSRSAQAQQ